MSNRISPLPVPSFHHWKFNFPGPSLQNQWRPVFYASGMTARHRRDIGLARKRREETAQKLFRSEVAAATKADVTASKLNFDGKLSHVIALNSLGLCDLATPHVEALHASGNMSSEAYAAVIQSYSAPRLVDHLFKSTAYFDKAQALKVAGDHSGTARVSHASDVLAMAADALPQLSAGHFNGLMATHLTAGFARTSEVHGKLYDSIGVAQVAPNVATYGHVVTALALTANTKEAEDIVRFLRVNAPEEVHVGLYNTLMLGARQEKDHEKVDVLWQQLADHRAPAPNVESVEQYLRSIIDLSYTPIAASNKQYGNWNVVEKKRIPGILKQMEALGLPRSQLSPPVINEVEDALRKFAIGRGRFYEWGRAVNLFGFANFRKKHGWMSEISDASPPVLHATSERPRGGEHGMAPALTTVLPGDNDLRPVWERPPLDHIMNRIDIVERNEEVRGGDKYTQDRVPIHERSQNWMLETPQTRYDKLYGVNNPQLSKMGIRRHLVRNEHVEQEEILAHDAKVAKAALAGGKRLRHKVDHARTHHHVNE